jgi:hypothetical protein
VRLKRLKRHACDQSVPVSRDWSSMVLSFRCVRERWLVVVARDLLLKERLDKEGAAGSAHVEIAHYRSAEKEQQASFTNATRRYRGRPETLRPALRS